MKWLIATRGSNGIEYRQENPALITHGPLQSAKTYRSRYGARIASFTGFNEYPVKASEPSTIPAPTAARLIRHRLRAIEETRYEPRLGR